jgi:hypothetical protein
VSIVSKSREQFARVKYPNKDHPILILPEGATHSAIILREQIRERTEKIINLSSCTNSLPIYSEEQEQEHQRSLEQCIQEIRRVREYGENNKALELPRINIEPPKVVNLILLWKNFRQWEKSLGDSPSGWHEAIADCVYALLCDLYGDPISEHVTASQKTITKIQSDYSAGLPLGWDSYNGECPVAVTPHSMNVLIEAMHEIDNNPRWYKRTNHEPTQLIRKFKARKQRIISGAYLGSTTARANVSSNLPRINYKDMAISFNVEMDYLLSKSNGNTNEGE